MPCFWAGASWRWPRSDFGFDARRVLTLEAPQNNRSVEEARSFYARALERIRALPGVESAAGVFLRPLWSTIGFDGIYVAEGQTDADGETNPHVNVESITPGYFEAMAHPARRRPRLHRRRRRAFVPEGSSSARALRDGRGRAPRRWAIVCECRWAQTLPTIRSG